VPFVCWLIPAASQRYKVNILQITGLILSLLFISYYLAPYSQVGRAFDTRNASFSANIKNNVLLLSNLELVRKIANESQTEFFSRTDLTLYRYYNENHGFADRLQMIAPDDAIINATENGAVFGIFPTIFAFENIVPHFIWHSKPTIQFGNMYAHEVGILTDDSDTTTGISFSPSGEAYHQAKWAGILIMLPALLLMLFVANDTCCGDTRQSPFALLPLIAFLHSAPEGGSTEIIRASTLELAIFGLAALVSCRLMPVIANLLVGPAKQQINTLDNNSFQSNNFVNVADVPIAHVAQAPSAPYRWSQPNSRT
jgi:hypothetical protein